ncbi:MAG: OmpH family outer membrane protein, partial [Planctomycetota bacterium]
MLINPKTIVLLALVATLAAALGVSAARRPPAQPTAVAVVDLVQVLEGLSERTDLERNLERELEARRQQIQEINNQMQTVQADLETLGREAPGYREKLRELFELRAVGEARTQAINQIVSIEKGAVFRELYEKIEAAIAEISARDGYDAVLLNDSTFPIPQNATDIDVERAILSRSVLYAHPSVDITDTLVAYM